MGTCDIIVKISVNKIVIYTEDHTHVCSYVATYVTTVASSFLTIKSLDKKAHNYK